MNSQVIRIRLIETGLQIKDLAIRTGIAYDRLQKILHGYRPAKDEEIASIANVLGVPLDALTKPAESPEANVD